MIAKGTLKISWGRGGAVEGVRAKHPRPPEKKNKNKNKTKRRKKQYEKNLSETVKKFNIWFECILIQSQLMKKIVKRI